MKQKHYYQYILAKQKKKTTVLGINNAHLITPVKITLRFLAPKNDVLAADGSWHPVNELLSKKILFYY